MIVTGSDQPVLKDAARVLNEPESEESKKALQEYIEAKRPAEELLAKQREWMDAKHRV